MRQSGFVRLFLVLFFLAGKTSDAFTKQTLVSRPPQRGRTVRTSWAINSGKSDDTGSPETRRNVVKKSLMWSLATALGLATQDALASTPPSALPLPTINNVEPTNRGIRYNTAKDIPESLIESHQFLFGYVEKVIDGDTIRIRHVPDVEAFLRASAIAATADVSTKPKMPSLANTTIVVRMYGIDAPETAKKQTEVSQPFGDDAKQLTKDLTYHKLVAVKLLRRDQYNRIVGEVETCAASIAGILSSSLSPSCTSSKDVSVELVSRGLATMYTGSGAEYDGKRDLLKQSVQAAQRSKLGIWSLGDELVTPQEYKRMKRLADQ